MKKGALLCGIILTAFTLSSCAENTNSHANNIGDSSGSLNTSSQSNTSGTSSQSNTSSTSSTSSQPNPFLNPNQQIQDGDMADISELYKNKDKYTDELHSQNYGNLNIGKDIEIKFPKEIGEYKIKDRDDLNSFSDVLLDKYVPKDSFDEANLTFGSEEKYGAQFGYDYVDKETGTTVSIGNCGFINTVNEKLDFENYSDKKERVYVGQKYEDRTVKLSDREAKISELLETAEKELAEYAALVKSEMSFSPVWCEICTDNKSGEQICDFEFGEDYKDVPLMRGINGSYSSFGGANENHTLFDTAGVHVFFSSSKHTDGFVVQSDFVSVKEIEKYSEILTPAAAARIASAKLSGYRRYNVVDVQLTYIPVADADIREQGYEYTLTPYWRFSAPDTESYDGEEHLIEHAVFINCITGELETIFG